MATEEKIAEITKHNEEIRKELRELQNEYNKKRKALKKLLIVPCEVCPYDGVYRCEACSHACYEGFNIRNYPN